MAVNHSLGGEQARSPGLITDSFTFFAPKDCRTNIVLYPLLGQDSVPKKFSSTGDVAFITQAGGIIQRTVTR